jgi:hypothetical protein
MFYSNIFSADNNCTEQQRNQQIKNCICFIILYVLSLADKDNQLVEEEEEAVSFRNK